MRLAIAAALIALAVPDCGDRAPAACTTGEVEGAMVWGDACAPLVVYSHGHHGRPESCGRLCPALARAGFLVVAPRHEDDGSLSQEAAARRRDVKRVLDRADRDKAAVIGHSFGGWTAAEAGAQDKRVKAVVSMAGTPGYIYMSVLRAPTLIIAGTRDDIETVGASQAAIEALPPDTPSRLMVVKGARHGDLLHSRQVRRTVTAFLEERLPR